MASGSRSPTESAARKAADNFDIYSDYDFNYNSPVFVSRTRRFVEELTKKQNKLDDWIRLLILRHSAYRIRAANGSREMEPIFRGLDLSRPLDAGIVFDASEVDGIDEPLAEPGSQEAYTQICRFMQLSKLISEERVAMANQLEDYLVRERMKVTPWVEELNAAEDRERAANDMSPRGGSGVPRLPGESPTKPSSSKRKRGKKEKEQPRKVELSSQLREWAEGFAAEYSGIPVSDIIKDATRSETPSESSK